MKTKWTRGYLMPRELPFAIAYALRRPLPMPLPVMVRVQ